MTTVTLHSGRERRILSGHLWVFSNEIADDLATFEPGGWVEVRSAKGQPLGTGYLNPHTLIAVRLVCRPGETFGEALVEARLREAALRRERIFPGETCYRLIYGESDGLPGLVVDRYGDVLVTQVATLGMARLEPLLHDMLERVFSPRCIVSRNDVGLRGLEGLDLEKGVARGELPDEVRTVVDGVEYGLDVLEGQKTGLYLDQRENRRAFCRFVAGRRVLDLFSYDGAWSLSAAKAGAAETVGVESSARAVARATENAARNGFAEVCHFEETNVFSYLKGLGRGVFDVIVCDPPAFAKTKKDIPAAAKGYIDLNRRAMLALRPGGVLVTCSCSFHVARETFEEVLLDAAKAAGKRFRLIEARGQSSDHPALLAMPETRYLKCMVLEAC